MIFGDFFIGETEVFCATASNRPWDVVHDIYRKITVKRPLKDKETHEEMTQRFDELRQAIFPFIYI
jgi:hypothetical protein